VQRVEIEFGDACREISQNLLAIPLPTSKDVKKAVKRICIKYSLERIPRNYEILASVSGQDFVKLQKVLIRKPVKTASGVAVIALMPRPYACPHGRCTYCPGGVEFNTPNSYTGREPSTQNAISNSYDPKKQILDKLDHLIAYGHDSTKLELVIVGGTFLFMPREYQISFVKSCYDALNGFDSPDLESAKKNNETAKVRNVGFTVETKPDYCKSHHVDWMLDYGITRVEIGVQSLHESVYEIVNRGHTFNDVVESIQVEKMLVTK
jgi:elongator complex protein 3